jgi:hypothetical protein
MRVTFVRSLGTLFLVLMLVLAACGGQEAAEEPTTAAEPTEATSEEEEEEPTPEEEEQEPTPEEEEQEPTPEEEEEEPTPEEEASGDIPAGWQEVTSEAGAFLVLMPGEPQEQTETVETEVGPVDANFVQVATQEGAYQVVYSDYPEEVIANSDTDELFQGAINGALENIDGELVSEEEISIDGNPGREFVAEASLEGINVTYKGRYFLVGNRLYQVFVVGNADAIEDDDITTFIDSFELLDSGATEEGGEEPAAEEPATEEGGEEPAAEEPATEEGGEAAPAGSGEGTVVAVGASDNRVSVLTAGGWVQPDLGLRGCLGSGNAFFDASGNPWVGCFSLVHSTDGGQTWNQVDVGGGDFSLGDTTALDPQNQIWFLSDDNITVLNADDTSVVASYTPAETTGEAGFPTNSITFADDGTVWLGGLNINGSDLVSFDGAEWQTYGEPEDMGLESFAHPDQVAINNEGQLLVFAGLNIYTLEDGTMTPLLPEDQALDLPSTINDILIMEDGSLWMASLQGIAIWDGSSLQIVNTEAGLPSNSIRDLAMDADGRVWAATNYGLAVQDGSGGWASALPSTSGLAESRLATVAVQGAPTLPPPGEEQTATITGRMVFNGEPVGDTTVQLCNEGGKSFFQETPCEDLPVQITVQTDAEGNFAFENVPLGTYGLTALNPNGEWVLFLTGIDALNAGQEVGLGDIELADDDDTGGEGEGTEEGGEGTE